MEICHFIVVGSIYYPIVLNTFLVKKLVHVANILPVFQKHFFSNYTVFCKLHVTTQLSKQYRICCLQKKRTRKDRSRRYQSSGQGVNNLYIRRDPVFLPRIYQPYTYHFCPGFRYRRSNKNAFNGGSIEHLSIGRE